MIRAFVEDKPNTGFAARLLYIFPEAKRGFRICRGVNNALAEEALARLWKLPASVQPIPCPLEEAAHKDLERWVNANIDACAAEEGLLSQWLAKQRGIALRIALIVDHLIWAAESPLAEAPPAEVSRERYLAACQFIDCYAAPMAKRTFALATLPSEARAAERLARLLKKNQVERFNAAKVRRSALGPVGELREPKVMEAACEALETAYLIQNVGIRADGKPGRKPLDFVVNPALLRA